ncbi:MAG: class I SAM-dependent methyltransferase [Pseudomonadota bacterium]
MTSAPLLVICNHESQRAKAEALALRLGVVVTMDCDIGKLTEPEFVVIFDEQGAALQQTGRKAPGPIRAEFTEGAVDHRRKFGGGKGQMIAKAVGVKAGVYPRVLDATAGLGKDAFVLATLGCRIQMLERSPCVHALLESGLARAREFAASEDLQLKQILARMELLNADSHEYLTQIADDDRPDVIYLDPMFPDRQKTADVKKEMAAFHHLVGKDEDADTLLEKALANAQYRVVVKRPRKAPFIGATSSGSNGIVSGGKIPSYQLEGKSSRFDIYTLKKMPDTLSHNH